MEKFGFLLSLVLAVNSFELWAQEDSSRISGFPEETKLYYNQEKNENEERTNIPKFFHDWEELSKLISEDAPDSPYNEIFSKYFCRYYGSKDTMFGGEQSCKYIVLPRTVKVIKYNRNIRKWYTNVYPKKVEPKWVIEFTPKVVLGKPVLYRIPEAENLLSSFISEPVKNRYSEEVTTEQQYELKQRRMRICDYVPALIAHWGNGWNFCSYPLINTIIVGKDGYIVTIDNADYSGIELFVTWSGKETEIGEWIQ